MIEPYYGGSHQAFLLGLMDNVSADYTLLTLPARKWKMRMQLSAPWFAAQVRKQPCADRGYDAVLCSTFVDVAVLRALLQQLDGWNPKARFCTYFHENQCVYPGQVTDGSMYQFQAINFTTALVSDRLAFNSSFNRDTFFENIQQYLKKSADMCIIDTHREISRKSTVLHPGIDYTPIDRAPEGSRQSQPVLVWNHRWEHDKNPQEFFTVVCSLKERGLPFKLIVLGQSFKNWPECFGHAKDYLSDRILHFGYADSRDDYGMLLKMGDIVISTAVHEFFGISVLEAVRAGCRPLLPWRLSYPELFPEEFLYPDGELEGCLAKALIKPTPLSAKMSTDYTEPYSWSRLANCYSDWLFG